ncbi:unnamed protein product, partial [Rotaria magnacalcarata]
NGQQKMRKVGMTWAKLSHHISFGIDMVGCDSWVKCNPYNGDTDCNTELPVICTKIDQSSRPPYVGIGIGHAMPPDYYQGWNQGHITTTMPIRASDFDTLARVDAFCAKSFGEGWRTAEVHDGKFIYGMNTAAYAGDSWTSATSQIRSGGWRFYSYGNTRFWAHINDQPSTCWRT